MKRIKRPAFFITENNNSLILELFFFGNNFLVLAKDSRYG